MTLWRPTRRRLILAAPTLVLARRAVAQNIIGGGIYGDIKRAGGSSPTTFDPANKNASFTLSGGNLIATAGSISNWISVRGTNSHSSGKYYCEFTMTTHNNTGNMVGICNGSFPVTTTGDFIGIDANSIGYNDDGNLYKSGSSFATVITFGAGSLIQMAYDAGTGNIWFKVGAGTWNNTGADPASGTGGIATGLGGTAVFPAAATFVTGDAWTANFGQSAYSGTAPTGFINW